MYEYAGMVLENYSCMSIRTTILLFVWYVYARL